ncbi:proteasome regulatory particle base subunit [Batrachochytrium dendrobatidis]|nr:proteasome regulatory particle base subunit [Batrachochytrium dendrobatidis]KAK5669640.1 proteasome regulatory particle base subunit [Batrachochytrium dendrobatidis]
MLAAPLTSAAGILSLLDEPQDELKAYALSKLDSLVDLFWAEVSDSVSKIEVLYEDASFKDRELAALVASKVYYHLGEFEESLTFALGAGKLFDLNQRSEYVETIVSKCIDKYIGLRAEMQEVPDRKVVINANLESIVHRMVARCYDLKEYLEVVGIALETFRLDLLEEVITKGNTRELLAYVYEANTKTMQNIVFRTKVFHLLVKLYGVLDSPDYISMSQCMVHVNDTAGTTNLLNTLIAGNETQVITAYQIAFDIEDSAPQDFILKVLVALPTPAESAVVAEAPVAADSTAMDTDEQTPLLKTEPSTTDSFLLKIRQILAGDLTIKLNLEFLHRNNRADLLILKNTKAVFDSRNSVYHTAVTFSNAFMNAGTTSDEFLRQNLEWLSRATNWTKFSATAALGVIHKGQISQSMALLAPYLPREGVAGSPYSEGGALFALGLINANHGTQVLPYLSKALKDTQDEVIQHGAALGLGVAGMSTGNEELYDDLKNVLFNDSAVAGEAAGIAMGLIMLGTASTKAVEEMLQYARETQHEKIIRGLALGLALIMFGREDQADEFIELLSTDKDPILRYGGMYTVALAYAGTGNNKAIRRLLHVAVSDVSDDARRAAVTAIGFVLYKSPQQVPRVVQLLSESFNPHVRYGATLALGISCASTNMKEAIALLEPMVKDPVDFVRQGAMIALGMILIQHNEASAPKLNTIRKLFETTISDKHEEVMSRYGAVLAQGIIDAGGRNVTISMQTRSGFPNIPAIVGTILFTHFWYWFPLTHMLSLAFTPTGVIGLNQKLEVPKFEFGVSGANQQLFAYVPPTKVPTAEVVEKVATAVLSTTIKAMARAKKAEKAKDKDGADDAMDTDEKKDALLESIESPAAGPDRKRKKKELPEVEVMQEFVENFSRVVPSHVQYVTFKEKSRYVPIKKESIGGIVMLMDTRPTEAEELIAISLFGPKNTTLDSQTPVLSPVDPPPAPPQNPGNM